MRTLQPGGDSGEGQGQGQGPNGEGPPGQGPDGEGPPGQGPDGEGPPGQGSPSGEEPDMPDIENIMVRENVMTNILLGDRYLDRTQLSHVSTQ